jgi:hypothetical protein
VRTLLHKYICVYIHTTQYETTAHMPDSIHDHSKHPTQQCMCTIRATYISQNVPYAADPQKNLHILANTYMGCSVIRSVHKKLHACMHACMHDILACMHDILSGLSIVLGRTKPYTYIHACIVYTYIDDILWAQTYIHDIYAALSIISTAHKNLYMHAHIHTYIHTYMTFTQVSALYPGRASNSVVIDMFITLLSMGKEGYKKMLSDVSSLDVYGIYVLSNVSSMDL